jgi:signal transduction histidine kinase
MDMTVDKQRTAQGPPLPRRVPWSPRAWSQAIFVAGGIPVQLIPWLLLTLLARGELRSQGGWNGKSWLAAILVTALVMLVLIPALTRVQSHRLRSAGADVPRQPRRPDWLSPGGVVAALRAPSTWRQVAYHLLAGPVIACAGIVAVGVWIGGAVYATVYLYGKALRPDSFIRHATYPQGPVDLAHPLGAPLGIFLTVAGIAGLLAAPWLTAGVASLDARVGRALLGPSRAEELEHRVEQLTQTRAGVVDAADAERRRLERDLHDGTQQRLVSLAMNLGMARAQEGNAEQANQAIAEAHEEAKAALAELRDLIRGLHPAVLEDRGLDAACPGSWPGRRSRAG